MHEAGYCVRYVSPVFPAPSYITSIDYDDRRFETSYDHNKALVMTAGDAEKFVKSFPEECMGFLEICEVYKHDENDVLRGNKLPAVVIDDCESLITQ